MNQPQPAQPQQVTHLVVTVDAYQAVLNVLQEMPYKTAAPVLQQLQNGTKPFEPSAAIVDDEDEEGAES